MNGSTIIFYLLAALTLICGVLSVSTRQIFRAAIYLLFSLIGIAGIYFWLDYQFVAAVQIVVYVGGIVVLIIFSIFLTQQAGDKLPKQKIGRKIFSALAVFCGFCPDHAAGLPASFLFNFRRTGTCNRRQYRKQDAEYRRWRLCITHLN